MVQVTIHGDRIAFPGICPACNMPATRLVPCEKRTEFGFLRQEVQLHIPYCDRHSEVLEQANSHLKRISTLSVIGGLVLWAAASYLLILMIPDLKIIPGNSFVAWAVSLPLVMCALPILLVISGVGLVIPFGLFLVHNLILRTFDTAEAKRLRQAMNIRTFDLPPAVMGQPKLRGVTFTVADVVYARHLSELNPGSTLKE